MGKFVKSSIDKGVQTIKNLVKPQSETTYDAPPPVKTYSLGKSNWSQIFYEIVSTVKLRAVDRSIIQFWNFLAKGYNI